MKRRRTTEFKKLKGLRPKKPRKRSRQHSLKEYKEALIKAKGFQSKAAEMRG